VARSSASQAGGGRHRPQISASRHRPKDYGNLPRAVAVAAKNAGLGYECCETTGQRLGL